jgi:hypothetical protein
VNTTPPPPDTTGAPGSVPLWRQLQATSAVLLAVRGGTSGTAALGRVEPMLRPAVQALTFDVLRSLARAEHLRRQLATRAPPPQADALLCVVLALGWREQGMAYTAFTLVNQAVEAAKRAPHAGPGRFHQRLPAPLPARARRAGGRAPTPTRWPAGTTRAGGSNA